MYEYHESHKHKFAKELLWKWLSEIDSSKEYSKDAELQLPFAWRTGNYGIHMELPFHKTDDPYYFECSEFVQHEDDESFDRGPILFVPDICIFHKGTPIYFIEVVHKNRTNEKKLSRIKQFFDGFFIEVYEIDAENILSQTNKFCNLKFTKVLCN